MDRREFFKKCVVTGIVAGTSTFIGKNTVFAADNSNSFDVVAVRNGSPEDMFDKGIECLGGMKNFVKKGQTVLIKPNMSFSSPPEKAATTNPLLVKKIVEQCIKAGAKKVYVIDHTLVYKSIEISGVGPAAKAAGAEIFPANKEKYYREVTIPGGKSLKATQVHELINSADVFINVPILKSHGGTKLTCALKNLMGVVWNRGYYHSHNLNQCIADFPLYRKPVLNVVDAYRVMVNGGPRGRSNSKVITPKMQFISTDIVAVDAVSLAQARQWNVLSGDVPYIKMAYDLKLGEMNLNKLKIKKIIM